MHLSDFFRMSVKVDRQMVELDDELDLLDAYMELMCYRYPSLHCRVQYRSRPWRCAGAQFYPSAPCGEQPAPWSEKQGI